MLGKLRLFFVTIYLCPHNQGRLLISSNSSLINDVRLKEDVLLTDPNGIFCESMQLYFYNFQMN